MTLRGRSASMRLAIGVAVIASLLVSCERTGQGSASAPPPPDWIERVYPPPGGNSAFEQVQVDFDPVFSPSNQNAPGNENVRLYVDGVDVTSYAQVTSARMTYHPVAGGAPPQQTQFPESRPGLPSGSSSPATGPVMLGPGLHTARLERVTLPELGADLKVLDTYEWSFTIQ